MKDSFLTQFTNKASKAHKKSADCFKAQDYMGFFAGHFEEGYYQTLAHAVSGQDCEDGQPVLNTFWSFFKIESKGNNRVTQALKKMGKLEKIAQIEDAIEPFFNDISGDLLALANKSTDIDRTTKGMSKSDWIETTLFARKNYDMDIVDKFFIEDKVIMGIINRRKAIGYIDKLIKEIHGILK
jgi:hypothetical protein